MSIQRVKSFEGLKKKKKTQKGNTCRRRNTSVLVRFVPGQRERSPDYQKLRVRDTRIWGIRRGQPNRSAMEGPHPGGTAFLITVTPTPGKYELMR